MPRNDSVWLFGGFAGKSYGMEVFRAQNNYTVTDVKSYYAGSSKCDCYLNYFIFRSHNCCSPLFNVFVFESFLAGIFTQGNLFTAGAANYSDGVLNKFQISSQGNIYSPCASSCCLGSKYVWVAAPQAPLFCWREN